MQWVHYDDPAAFAGLGNNIPTSIAKIASTTYSSISVKPFKAGLCFNSLRKRQIRLHHRWGLNLNN